MKDDILKISTIAQAHQIFGLGKPKHPLVSVIWHNNININESYLHVRCSLGMYYIGCKTETEGQIKYGRNSYDFEDGSMIFLKPQQVLSYEGHTADSSSCGWTLLFHPDLIAKSELGKSIDNYSYFSYDTTEALHLSEDERKTLNEILRKIEKEYRHNIDRHSQKLIVANIELLLDYCTRYYDRQFFTRTNLNKDILTRFEQLLGEYYAKENQIKFGIPTVNYCGQELNVSPKYLSDMLKRETGKNAKNHIDDYLITKAKNQLLGSSDSISEVAYSLGFEYPQHFAKVFKAKTGFSPSNFRNVN